MKKTVKGALAILLSLTMVATPYTGPMGSKGEVKAATQKGSLATKVTGTWSYWDGKVDVVRTNESLLEKLPTLANKGTTRFTTDNYDNNYGAFKSNGWSTSMSWNYSNTANPNFGNAVYALPLAYIGKADGMVVSKPATKVVENALISNCPEDGSLSDFKVLSGFSSSSLETDKVSDWSTEVILKNQADSSQSMRTTMTQGSPFAQFQMTGTTTAAIQRMRTGLHSKVVAYNGSSPSTSTYIIMAVYDNHDEGDQVSNVDFYGVFVPEGTTWDPNTDGDIGKITMNFPSASKSYFTYAWLGESYIAGGLDGSLTKSVAEMKAIAETYSDYAFNFVTDTGVTYDYNRSTGMVTTNYNYKYEKKDSTKPDGVIMGLLPSQYKNMTGYNYLSNKARTIRGYIKYLIGDTYKTELKYSGILPSNTSVDTSSKDKLQSYVDSFMKDYGPTETELTKQEKVSVNTYDSGKRMNRAIQVMEAAEECGDQTTADTLLKALENELADWFTCDNSTNAEDKYFYYDKNIGSLFGFPQAYYTVDGITDHHFHYGYFIQAAAQVALRDPSFIAQYSDIVNKLIKDIANDSKDSKDSAYPYLRAFSTYEGHSWASGHGNFGDGNDQESSSEAINAWAALILYGQATGDEKLTDLGVYLYTTETNAVNNYWFDIDGDNFDAADPLYRKSKTSNMIHNQVTNLWSGKLDYGAWWTAEPLQTQGINLLPITSASYYLAKSTKFVQENFDIAQTNESKYTGQDKDVNRWNELWSSYIALANTDKAESYFDDTVDPEAGDSKAHAYHFIQSLKKAGTPNLDVSSDDPLSAVFEDENGNVTYAAYNAGSTEKTVTFSDGKVVQVPAGQQVEVKNGSSAYKVEYYKQNADLSYSLAESENKTAPAGRTVKAGTKSYTGYILDETVSDSKTSGVVTDDNALVLKAYYRLRTPQDEPETTTTTAPQPSDPSLYNTYNYTDSGQTYDGLGISYYVVSDDFNSNQTVLDEGKSFYISYSSDFGAEDIKATLNGEEIHPGLGTLNVSATTMNKNAYNCIFATYKDEKSLEIIVKYGNPTGTGETTKPGETTTQAQGDAIDWSSLSGWTPIGTTDLSYKVVKGEDQFGEVKDGDPAAIFVTFKAAISNGKVVGPKKNVSVPATFQGAEVKLNASNFTETGYYTISGTAGASEITIAVKKGTPGEIPTTVTPATTVTPVTTVTPATSATPVTTVSPTTAQIVVDTPTGFAPSIVGSNVVMNFNLVTDATSYNLYVDGVFNKAIIVGENIPVNSFTNGNHQFAITALKGTAESAKTAPVTLNIQGSDATTAAHTTAAPTTVIPTTVTPVTTAVPTTEGATTVAPTSEVPTTVAPTKPPVTTAKPTTTTAKVVAPAKVTVTKAKAAKKKVSLSFKKKTGVKGFKIQYSTSKKFKKAKSKTTTKSKYTIKKLKSKKKYYIRVKAYKVVNGKKVYSKKWSKVKVVKIK